MSKRYRIDFLLLGSVIIVVLAGILTLYSQERIIEEAADQRWIRQLIFFLVALPICLLIRRMNYQYLGGYAVPFYLFALALLLITLVPFVGSSIKGARSWIRLGPVGIQTSEVAKLATIILLAKYLEMKEREMDRIPSLFIPFALTLIPMVLVVIQPDFGGAFTFAPILLTMLFMGGADIYHISSVVVFFGLSLSIPLYIEYNKITLVEPLLYHLSELGKGDLLPAVRILKTDIWNFIDSGAIPAAVNSAQDRSYLQAILGNSDLLTALREAAFDIRYEAGGILLRLLENETLLIVLGIVFSLTSLTLFIIRFSQGTSMARLRKFYIPLGVLGISLLAAVMVHMTFSFRYYQVVRVTAFINPDKFPRDEAYHIRASRAAIGSGQFTGRGIFKGDMTMGERPLVPESSTDFIFASWSERMGFLGAVFVLLLLVSIPLRGLQISFEARDRFGSMLAVGISAMFFYHIIFNAGIALGLLPVTGLPLSFMSYGGSHLFISMLSVGILLSIHRRKHAN